MPAPTSPMRAILIASVVSTPTMVGTMAIAAATIAVIAPEIWAIVVTPRGGESIAWGVVLLLLEVRKFSINVPPHLVGLYPIRPQRDEFAMNRGVSLSFDRTPSYASAPCCLA